VNINYEQFSPDEDSLISPSYGTSGKSFSEAFFPSIHLCMQVKQLNVQPNKLNITNETHSVL